MKQSIQLRLGQHLAMTPQLQQAIRLLQLSTLELQLEIQNTLDSNLMLEVDEEEHPGQTGPVDTSDEADYRHETTGSEGETEPEAEYPSQEGGIPDELATDSSWEDTFDNTNADGSSPYSQPEDGGRDRLELAGDSTETLYDHLMWQMHLTPFSDTDQAIAMSVIDAINDDGYLDQTLEEIHQGLNGELDLSIEEVEAVLHRVQNFDPVGVGARNLQECLLIQLRQFAPDTPWLKEATRVVEQHLDLLGSRDYNQLMRQTRLNEQQLSEVIGLIQSLNPRPGSQIATEPPQYIVPDVLVKKVRGKWRVELNPETAPKLRINSHYASLVKRADNSDDNNYLKNHLQEARWFMKSLQSRNETLLKVAGSIVERQRDFLDQGEQAMKPLVLRDVAEAVEMHESTISRITTQKYMHTPRGIFEFKYFFSSHVGTTDGGEASATAIRAIIRKLVAEEKATKPLSDSKLAKLLLDQGINVARRTVAKYRETLNIPPSNERKRLT